MSAIDALKTHSVGSGTKILEGSQLNEQGLLELNETLRRVLDRMRGVDLTNIEPMPRERPSNGLPALIETTARLISACLQSAHDIEDML
jgi:hypothetical protein